LSLAAVHLRYLPYNVFRLALRMAQKGQWQSMDTASALRQSGQEQLWNIDDFLQKNETLLSALDEEASHYIMSQHSSVTLESFAVHHES